MNRKIAFLNFVLIAGVVYAGLEYRKHALAARRQQNAVIQRGLPPAPVLSAPAVPSPQPLEAQSYLDVASRMLFSKDRNPNVVIEQAPEKPVPPFPVANGVMDLGFGPTVFMSEKSGAPQKGYRVGDKIGAFKLASVSGRDLVFEWEGKQFKKSVDDLKEKEKGPDPSAAAASSPAQSGTTPQQLSNRHEITPPEKLAELQKPDASGQPGIDIGGSERACAPNDTAPAGAVVGGFRKVVTPTPFGQTCRWVPAR